MIPYKFHPDALEEAEASAIFYNSKRPGLDKRFIDSLEEAIIRVRRNPLIYRKVEVDENIRKCRLLRFPYCLIYRVFDDYIEILAVMPLRKKPGYWQERV